MYQVEIERSRYGFGDDVWIYARVSNGVLVLGGNGQEDRLITEGSADRGDPTFRIPPDVREALGAALLGQTMPTDSMARHLADAIATRDRLLTLVERS